MASLVEQSTASERYLDHLAEYKILICRLCRQIISQAYEEKGVLTHFQRQHGRDVPNVDDRVALHQYASSLRDRLLPPEKVEIPIDIPPAFDVLEPPVQGFLCINAPETCRQWASSETEIRHHCSQSFHTCPQWSQYGRAGQPSAAQKAKATAERPGPWIQHAAQRFARSGVGSRYFPVYVPSSEEGDEAHSRPSTLLDQLVEAGRRRQQILAMEAADRIIPPEAHEVHAFVELTGCAEALRGRSRAHTLELIRLPTPRDEDAKALQMCVALEHLVHVWQHTLKYRARVYPRIMVMATPSSGRRALPMHSYQKQQSVSAHARPLKQLFLFFHRAYDLAIGRQHVNCPSVRLTAKQKTVWSHLQSVLTTVDDLMPEDALDARVDERRTTLTKLERACQSFWISLLSQRARSGEHDLAVHSPLACMQISMTSYEPVGNVTKGLSSLINAARCAVLQIAHDEAFEDEIGIQQDEKWILVTETEADGIAHHVALDQELGWKEEEEEPSAIAIVNADRSEQQNTTKPGVLRLTEYLSEHLLARSAANTVRDSPMQWMLFIRDEGLQIHSRQTSLGNLRWEGEHTMCYRDMRFSLADFYGAIQGQIYTARQRLEREVLAVRSPVQLPRIPWEALWDDPNCSLPEYNFLAHPASKAALAEAERTSGQPLDDSKPFWLLRHLQDPNRSALPGVQDRKWVRRWLARVERYEADLYRICHYAGGPPARGTEECASLSQNGSGGTHRNVFFKQGMVCLVPSYHKGFFKTMRAKVIHHFLPRKVGEQLLYYLWLVRPVADLLELAIDPKATIEPYLWRARDGQHQLDSSRLSRALQEGFEQTLGHRIGLQDYRHMATSIGHRVVTRADDLYRLDGEDVEESSDGRPLSFKLLSVLDRLSAHSHSTGQNRYGRDPDQLSGETFVGEHMCLYGCQQWHAALGLTTTISQRGRVASPSPSSPRRRQPDDEEGGPSSIKRPRIAEDERLATMMARVRSHLSIDKLEQLRLLYGPTAQFRGQQERALEHILRGDSPLTIVEPTGLGKSLLFMLPASLPGHNLTVVVVPLLALQRDLLQRCASLKIRCAVWSPARPPVNASILLFTPEALGTEAARNYLRVRAAHGGIDRIVYDEAHGILDPNLAWRPARLDLGQVFIPAATQLVFLSATLPPSEEPRLRDLLGIPHEGAFTLRAPTIHKHMAFSVSTLEEAYTQARRGSHSLPLHPPASMARPITDKVLIRYMVEVVDAAERSLAVGQKLIVFWNHKKRIDDVMARRSNWLGFHADIRDQHKDDPMARDVLAEFATNPQARVLFTSSAGGSGWDAKSVVLTLHVEYSDGQARSLEDLVQEGGRGGRNGEPCRCSIIVLPSRPAAGHAGLEHRRQASASRQFTEETQPKMVGYLQLHMNAKRCRRSILASYLDGDDQRPSYCMADQGEALCDVCHTRQSLCGEDADQVTMDDVFAYTPAEEPRSDRTPTSSSQYALPSPPSQISLPLPAPPHTPIVEDDGYSIDDDDRHSPPSPPGTSRSRPYVLDGSSSVIRTSSPASSSPLASRSTQLDSTPSRVRRLDSKTSSPSLIASATTTPSRPTDFVTGSVVLARQLDDNGLRQRAFHQLQQHEAPRIAAQKRKQQVHAMLARVAKQYDYWLEHTCIACTLLGQPQHAYQSLPEGLYVSGACPNASLSKAITTRAEELHSRIKRPDMLPRLQYRLCITCAAPQALCGRYGQRKDNKGWFRYKESDVEANSSYYCHYHNSETGASHLMYRVAASLWVDGSPFHQQWKAEVARICKAAGRAFPRHASDIAIFLLGKGNVDDRSTLLTNQLTESIVWLTELLVQQGEGADGLGGKNAATESPERVGLGAGAATKSLEKEPPPEG